MANSWQVRWTSVRDLGNYLPYLAVDKKSRPIFAGTRAKIGRLFCQQRAYLPTLVPFNLPFITVVTKGAGQRSGMGSKIVAASDTMDVRSQHCMKVFRRPHPPRAPEKFPTLYVVRNFLKSVYGLPPVAPSTAHHSTRIEGESRHRTSTKCTI